MEIQDSQTFEPEYEADAYEAEAPYEQQTSSNGGWDNYLAELFAPREDPNAVVAGLQGQVHALEHDRLERDVAALEEDYPALQEIEIAEEVVAVAQQQAARLGRPDLWRDTRFIRQVVEALGGDEGLKPYKERFAEDLMRENSLRNSGGHTWW